MPIDRQALPPPTDEERFHDIVDGVRIVKHHTVRDILLLNRLVRQMGGFDFDKNLGRLFFGLNYDLGLGESTQRMPDLSFVSDARWPVNKRLPREDPWRMVPDLVVDVITDETSLDQNRRKVREYRSAGVRLAWLIFPDDRRATVFRPDSSAILDAREGALDGAEVFPGFRMSLASLFDDSY